MIRRFDFQQYLIFQVMMSRQEMAIIACIVLASAFVILNIIGLWSTIALIFIFILTTILAWINWKKIREKGIIQFASPKTKQFLLHRSIMDIFRDLLYFPTISKIIGAFIQAAVSKPAPSELQQSFKHLPKSLYEPTLKKGLLSLAPQFVEKIVLPLDKHSLPAHYGQIDWSWDHHQKYLNIIEKPHEETIGKQIIHALDKRIGWVGAFSLIGFTYLGIRQMKSSKFKKILISNATFCCMVLSVVIILVKLKKVIRQSQIKHKKLIAKSISQAERLKCQ